MQHPSIAETAARVVYLLSSVITALLGLRFVFALFGANPANPFADFVYSISHPLAAPFFGLFGYQPQAGASRFELETLVAIIVYSLVARLLVRFLGTFDQGADTYIED